MNPEIIIVIVVAAVLFGGSRIPQLARSLGSAKHEFEDALEGHKADKTVKTEKVEVVEVVKTVPAAVTVGERTSADATTSIK